MSRWVDSLRSASFRGVAFHVVEAPEIEIGRRTADHEYAGREEPYSEDMGRKQRLYTLEGAVYGNDFIAQANKLQDAFEAHNESAKKWIAELEEMAKNAGGAQEQHASCSIAR